VRIIAVENVRPAFFLRNLENPTISKDTQHQRLFEITRSSQYAR